MGWNTRGLGTAAHIRRGLEDQGYAVDLAADGPEAAWLVGQHPYDAMVLDVMMLGDDGVWLVRRRRQEGVRYVAALRWS